MRPSKYRPMATFSAVASACRSSTRIAVSRSCLASSPAVLAGEGPFRVTVVGGSGTGRAAPGSNVSVRARVPDGRTFRRWAGDVELLSDPTRPEGAFTMPRRHVTLLAVFE